MNSPIKLPQLIFKNLMFVVVYIWVHWKYTRPYFPHFSQQPQNKGSTGQKKKKDPTGKFHEISKFNRLEHSKAYHSKGSDGRTEDLKQIFFTSATILLPKIGPFFYIFLNLICVKFWSCYWEEFFSSYLLTLKRCLHPRGEVSPLSWAGRLVVRLPYPLRRTWVISLGTRLNNAWTTCENERKQRKPSLFWSTLLSPTWKLNLISWSGCTKVVITGNFYVSALSGFCSVQLLS